MASQTVAGIKVIEGATVDSSKAHYVAPDGWSCGGELFFHEGMGYHAVKGSCADYPLAKIEITGRTLRLSHSDFYKVRARLTLAAIEGLEAETLSADLFVRLS